MKGGKKSQAGYMDIIEKAHIKLAFIDNYLSFILGGINIEATQEDITYFGTKFIMAIQYDASSQEFTLLYNPRELAKEKYGTLQVVALLQHELGHILANHFSRQEDREPLRWNLAADMAMDQSIPNIPRPQKDIEMMRKRFKEMIAEEIYWKLTPKDTKTPPKSIFVMINSKGPSTCPQCGGSGKDQCPTCEGDKEVDCNSCGGDGKEKDKDGKPTGKPCKDCQGTGKQECPDCQGSGQGKDKCPMCGGSGQVQNRPIQLPREEVKGAVDKLVKETTGKDLKDIAYGDQPGIWETVRRAIKSEEIDWRIIPKYLASFRDRVRRTLKRPSKRFPSPWGKRKEYKPKVSICVDCSGSIDDMELDAFVAEVDRLTMITGDIHLVFSDCRVQKTIEKYKAHQGLGNIPGRGGTNYEPALDYVQKNWTDTDLIVYLTDGECHPPTKRYKIPIIWIVTRNYNLDVKPMIKAPGLSKRGRY